MDILKQEWEQNQSKLVSFLRDPLFGFVNEDGTIDLEDIQNNIREYLNIKILIIKDEH